MKIIVAALSLLLLAAAPAKAATPLDGTFNGTFSCPKFQGVSNAFMSFFVTGNRVRAILTIYWSKDSKSRFHTSLLTYSGSYNTGARSFALTGIQELGIEPQGWTYDRTINGLVSADGSRIRVQGSASCSAITASRVTTTSAISR